MIYANFHQRRTIDSSTVITLCAMAELAVGTGLILIYEAQNQPKQLLFILGLYAILSLGAWLYAENRRRNNQQ